MRKIIFCLLTLICVACSKEIDLGYPTTVTFSSDGGEQIISSSKPFYGAYIQNYDNGDHGSVEQKDEFGNQYSTYKWLTIVYNEQENTYANQLTLIAEPNTSGKSRQLWIELYSGPDYQVVNVKQK